MKTNKKNNNNNKSNKKTTKKEISILYTKNCRKITTNPAGLQFCSGSGSHEDELFSVLRIAKVKPFARNFKVADAVLKVNDRLTKDMSCKEVMNYLSKSRNQKEVRFIVCRPQKGVLPDLEVLTEELKYYSDDVAVKDNLDNTYASIETQESPYEILRIDLSRRSSCSLGFSLIQASDAQRSALLVRTLTPNGVAHLDGRLRVDDRLLQVNDKSVIGMNHSHVVSLIREAKSNIKLTVSRSSSDTSIDDIVAANRVQATPPSATTVVVPPCHAHSRPTTIADENISSSDPRLNSDYLIDPASPPRHRRNSHRSDQPRPLAESRNLTKPLPLAQTAIPSYDCVEARIDVGSSPSEHSDSCSDHHPHHHHNSDHYNNQYHHHHDHRKGNSGIVYASCGEDSDERDAAYCRRGGGGVGGDGGELREETHATTPGGREERNYGYAGGESEIYVSPANQYYADEPIGSRTHNLDSRCTSVHSTPRRSFSHPVPSYRSLPRSGEMNSSSTARGATATPSTNQTPRKPPRRCSSLGCLVSENDLYFSRLQGQGHYRGRALANLIKKLESSISKEIHIEQYKELRKVIFSDECSIAKRYSEKNRYRNILPYNKNRVVLHSGDCDYINASDIQIQVDSQKNLKYLACQSPMKQTVDDFWTMVWQENCEVIAMLTRFSENGHSKCYDYLPANNSVDCRVNTANGLRISLKNCTIFDSMTTRLLSIEQTTTGEMRHMTHLQFTDWPINGCPVKCDSLLKFINMVRKHRSSQAIVVHCSAGVGRTGVFMLLDIVIESIARNVKFDIEKLTHHLRTKRQGIIQTKDQYCFCYRSCLEILRTFL